MQKISCFELAMALKDRPKGFQFITLVLLSFSLTIILLSSVAHLSGNEKAKEAFRQHNENNYAGMLPNPATQLLHLKK